MDLSQLHFAHPQWLWILLMIPVMWGLFFFFFREQESIHQLEKFIDKHLIPFLLLGNEHKKKRIWPTLLFWSFAWACLAFALAGPRWNFREIDTYSRDQNLAILLDLSESMNAQDVTPSRLGRAKQKIEDILNMSKGVKIGLVAFAADPHMIVPMTEDKETIRHLVPSLNTDLVYIQGSKLAPALEMAATMLDNEPGHNKAILMISDGGFEDASAIYTAKKLAEKGIILHTMGVGSLEGAPLKDRQGAIVKKNGSTVLSKLEKEKFSEISKIGSGRYFEADHSNQIAVLFEDLEKRSDVQQKAHKTQRIWDEQFYLFLLPVLPFFLWWYRRGYILALLLFISLPSYSEASLASYFYNNEQQANQAFVNEDYTTASQTFEDPYRKGVAFYRQGDYASAEEMFKQSTRPEVASSAKYNLGNALAQQNKLEEAIAAYEDVLKNSPDHLKAKENLEIVKKMLEEQKQQDQNKQKNKQNDKQNDKQNNKQKDKQKQNQQKEDNQEQKQQDQEEQQEQDKQNNQEDSDQQDNQQDNQQDGESKDEEGDSQQNQEDQSDQPSETGKPKEPKDEESQQGIDELQQSKTEPASSQETKEKAAPRSQEDLDADLWLNQIKNDPKSFLKNKFYLESKKNGTKEEVDPW